LKVYIQSTRPRAKRPRSFFVHFSDIDNASKQSIPFLRDIITKNLIDVDVKCSSTCPKKREKSIWYNVDVDKTKAGRRRKGEECTERSVAEKRP